MIRWLLFLSLAGTLCAYAFWVYLRMDLSVPGARRLAVLRAAALVVVLALLFDVRLPASAVGGVPTDWVLLDASLSMAAQGVDGVSAWQAAAERARALGDQGFHVVTFGDDPPASDPSDEAPSELGSLLVPALQRAAEGGARRVVVLSDLRLEDAVALRSTLQALPLEVELEAFGGSVPNAGISRFEVADFPLAEQEGTAEVEVHGGAPGDSLAVEIREEDVVVATTRVSAPAAGLRRAVTLRLPPPSRGGRVRYTASVRASADAFDGDDEAVDYAAVGRQEGALVVLSLRPDWEPRFLLPVLAEVTGLPTVGYLRAGADRFVQAGRAVDRAGPVDSATVGRAVTDAALVVVHGLGGDLDAWARALVRAPGRRILMPRDVGGAELAGLAASAAQGGEWYVSADVPASPIAGALAGIALQGLPPLADVLLARETTAPAPLLLQLRGAGTPVPALHLEERTQGRVAITVASGFWRWASREVGRDAYRRLWSGVAGWLLADQAVLAAEPRPARWVFERGAPVVWSVPETAAGARVVVQGGDSIVVDTVLTGPGVVATGPLAPGPYAFRFEGVGGDTLGAGRFDVAARTDEMLPAPLALPEPLVGAALVDAGPGRGVPLRTSPWPYLLVIALLCGEWIGRRRSGLR